MRKEIIKLIPSIPQDSTAQIQAAIDAGKRCGEKCNGSTTKNAIVYFPPGKYLVSSTLKLSFGTQVIGDANNWPRIVAASSFVGLGVLSTDVYVDGGGIGPDGQSLEWYINTARFYSQIRNLRVDITATNPDAHVCAIHYQVAQATSLSNVELIAKTGTVSLALFGRCPADLYSLDSAGHVFRKRKWWLHVRYYIYGWKRWLL
jgi:Pectate lyase superfamily protein